MNNRKKTLLSQAFALGLICTNFLAFGAKSKVMQNMVGRQNTAIEHYIKQQPSSNICAEKE